MVTVNQNQTYLARNIAVIVIDHQKYQGIVKARLK